MKRLVGAQPIAEALDITTARLYTLVRANQIPHVRLGKSVKFDPERIEAWIAAGGTAPSNGKNGHTSDG